MKKMIWSLINNPSQMNHLFHKKKETDGFDVELSKDDLSKDLSEDLDHARLAHKSLKKEYDDLRVMLEKKYLKKYHILGPNKLNALNYKSLERLEDSLINYCEMNNLNYTKPISDLASFQVKDDSVSKVHAKRPKALFIV